MSLSPARAHRARTLAALSAAAAPAGGEVVGGAYELMLAQLVEHRRQLRDIQSVERKIEAKRVFLPAYRDWVEQTLEHGQGAQDQVLMTVLVWLIDVGDFGTALMVARYALAHGLKMPDQYDRNLATVLLDEIGGAALSGKTLFGSECIRVLEQICEMTQGEDTPDQARAKVHKALGYAYMGRRGGSEVDVNQLDLPAARLALQQCRRAYELFEQVGVKKDIERLERRLKAADDSGA
ncbi:phage terminase small subunit [Roseateles sp. SL47]|uniref:phage terminase small subunit n=1 Tax=Roseateles sp. SL47 TaxID=2995138 RepID=UPI0022700B18|nr:phage terminase small subunit [Roseateles sp. SL47]WAC70813.1 phage terminase small subunit [Roseateles sp. SL47]